MSAQIIIFPTGKKTGRRGSGQVLPFAKSRAKIHTPFQQGDAVILGIKNDKGHIANWRGFLGTQDMKSGRWYVITPDWQGYVSEKSPRHAPTNGEVA